jgi:hypothetical protein
MTRQLDAAVDVALEIERELRVLTPDKPTLRCFIAECLARGDATYEGRGSQRATGGEAFRAALGMRDLHPTLDPGLQATAFPSPRQRSGSARCIGTRRIRRFSSWVAIRRNFSCGGLGRCEVDPTLRSRFLALARWPRRRGLRIWAGVTESPSVGMFGGKRDESGIGRGLSEVVTPLVLRPHDAESSMLFLGNDGYRFSVRAPHMPPTRIPQMRIGLGLCPS